MAHGPTQQVVPKRWHQTQEFPISLPALCYRNRGKQIIVDNMELW
jgi:hypothetical protein